MHCLPNLLEPHVQAKASSLDKVKYYGHQIGMLFHQCYLHSGQLRKIQSNLNISSNERASEGLCSEKAHSTQGQQQKMLHAHSLTQC